MFLIALTYLGFISLGLPDAVTGVVWPSMSRHFGVPAGMYGTLVLASAAGYMVSTTLAGRLLRAAGVGGLLAGSSALMVLALAGFAWAPAWWVFLALAAVGGLGSGAIDAGLNAHAARHFSARQMSWLHACWAIGATLGATTAAAVVARGVGWQWTYAILAAAMGALTLLFTLTRGVWPREGPTAAQVETPASWALKHPLVWWQVAIFCLYTGVEATTGQWAFTLLIQLRPADLATAGAAVTAYWGALTAGRFVLGAIADRVGVDRLVPGAATAALAGLAAFTFAPTVPAAIAGLAFTGFALAPIYPGMMTQTPRRLGGLADHAVGFQAAGGMLGTLTWPSLGGFVLQTMGVTHLAWLPFAVGALLWLLVCGLFVSGRTAGRGVS